MIMDSLVLTSDDLTGMGKTPKGRVLSLTAADGKGLDYFLYIPVTATRSSRLFVSIHGLTRNAVSHIMLFRDYADRAGVVCVAPCFCRERNRYFQQLRPGISEQRPDVALNKVLDEVSGMLGRPFTGADFFGYSGGGQFVHRYGMLHPERVRKAVIAAPGWYTFPDNTLPFPYGVEANEYVSGIDLDRFLELPFAVIVGERDTARDNTLNKSALIDKCQGPNRLERGKRWVAAIEAACAERHLPCNTTLAVLPGARHSFERGMRFQGLGDFVFHHLVDLPEKR